MEEIKKSNKKAQSIIQRKVLNGHHKAKINKFILKIYNNKNIVRTLN